MQEIDRFVASLFEGRKEKLEDIKFFDGEASVTVSEFCKHARADLLRVMAGTVEGQDTFPETFVRVSVDHFLAKA